MISNSLLTVWEIGNYILRFSPLDVKTLIDKTENVYLHYLVVSHQENPSSTFHIKNIFLIFECLLW